MSEVPILTAFLACAVPLAALFVVFKTTIAAAWNGPLARRLRNSHWTVQVAALFAVALVTAHGGSKGDGGTNTLVLTSGGTNTLVVVSGGQTNAVDASVNATDSLESATVDAQEIAAMVEDLQDADLARLGLDPDGDEAAALLGGGAGVPSWYHYSRIDTDQDFIPDLWETWTRGNPLAQDSLLDRDDDGLNDLYEFWNQTDPRTADTDGDGLSDGLEVVNEMDPLVKADYENVVEPDADTNNVPDYWEGSSYAWFTDSDQDGFDDSLALPEGVAEGGVVAVTLTTTRTAALAWGGDGFSGGLLVRPCTNRTVRFRVPAGFDTTLALLPPAVATNSCWKARMRVAWDPGNARPFEGPRLSLADGAVLRLDPTVEGTRTYLAAGSGFADNPETRILRHSIHLLQEGNRCTIHGGDAVVTAVYTNTAPPFRWSLHDDENSWYVTDQTGTVFDASSLGIGSYTVKCSESTLGNAAFVAWAETDLGVYCCQPVETNYWGAESRLGEHVPGTVTNYTGYPPPCEPIDSILHYVGFDHEKVRTRNLSVISQNRPPDECRTHHCLGVVWSAGGKLDLFSLLGDNYLSCKDDLHFTSDNLTVNNDGELVFSRRPPADMEPAVSLVTLHHASEQGGDREFDHVWVVVNSPETKTSFDGWYARNADTSWTSSLPQPFASLSFTFVEGGVEPVDPEPSLPSQWGTPHPVASYLHHDAKYEMRSNPIAGGHGHQATYDANGALIEYPIAAGTADIFAPYDAEGNPRKNTTHRNQDVYPFIRALQLDGNPVHRVGDILWVIDAPANLDRPCLYKGTNTGKYVDKRPVLPTGSQ